MPGKGDNGVGGRGGVVTASGGEEVLHGFQAIGGSCPNMGVAAH